MKATILFSLFILISIFTNAQQNFESALNQLFALPEYKYATVGIEIYDLNTDEPLFNYNSDNLIVPASTMKLVTTGAALEILGADYRFKTKVGYTGEIGEKTLSGDIVVIGGGDPSLGSMYFDDIFENKYFLDEWCRKIKEAGIEQVDGDLVLDVSLYDSEKIPPTWVWEDMGNYYGAGSSALTVYDDLFRITFSSPAKAGEKTIVISTDPEIPWLEIQNEVLSSEENSDEAYVFGSPLDNRIIIRGTIPKNKSSFSIKASVQHPEKVLAEKLMTHFEKVGIQISGTVKFHKVDDANFHSIYTQQSPALADIIKELNHESVNLFAEHMVKQIAAEKTGIGSRKDGIDIIKEFWKLRGMNEIFFMEDGSGLSHFNAISPSNFIALLKYMRQSKSADAFYNSLPAAGEGTLTRFDTSIFEGNTLKAKSGSMTRVRCYSGYLKADSGKELAFSFMFNDFDGSHSRLVAEIQKLFVTMKSSY